MTGDRRDVPADDGWAERVTKTLDAADETMDDIDRMIRQHDWRKAARDLREGRSTSYGFVAGEATRVRRLRRRTNTPRPNGSAS